MDGHRIEPKAFLSVLVELAAIREAVARLEHQTVNLVRLSGATWEDVGISRQAAARKYGRPRRRLI